MITARYMSVTHQSAEAHDASQRRHAEAAADAYRRAQRDRAQAEKWDEIDSPAVRRFAARGAVGVNSEGSVEQTFACHCGKHSHGHGEPEHADGFAKFTRPTRSEASEVPWAGQARADEERQERARALAKRVQAASHPRTPSAAGAAMSPEPGRGPKTVRVVVGKDQTR
jgi:hypothetical protein